MNHLILVLNCGSSSIKFALYETDANGVAESLTSCFPEADVSLVSGGQPVYYYMIAAE